MPVEPGSSNFKIVSGWLYRAGDDGVFQPAEQQGGLLASLAIDAAVYNHKLYLPFVLAAGAEQIIDVRSFTSRALGERVTAARALTFELRATGPEGGQVRVRPHTANALRWCFGSATDSVTLSVGEHGQCALAWQDGEAVTVSDAERNLSISNPGTQPVTVALAITVGE